MKGVVLAAGSGTRMRPIAYSMAKQLIPVANKPILFYALDDVFASGVSEVAIVVAPDTGDEIRRAVGDGSQFGLDVDYVVQPEPLGIAHALGVAGPWVGDDDVLLYLGDNMLKGGVGSTVAAFRQLRPSCHILLSRVENPQRFGVATVGADGRVVELVEKPEHPASDLALAGIYLFDPSIWPAIESLQPSGRGEYEITDAIQWLLDSGREVHASEVSGWWKDTGTKEDLLDANDLVLEALVSEIAGEITATTVTGALAVGAGTELRGCEVRGPVVVGRSSVVTDSVLGPGTAIGDDCVVTGAELTRSVLLDGVQVETWKLRNSLLGRHVSLRGRGPDTAVPLMLGERSEVVGA
ncbi:MAG: glucose-1-phosphate thymidylyltransferase [Acidimicrobiia bacterium]|nr:glucose-1-phosphate thymidylyltransferase [Acidimicrobiia bacterium]